MKCAMCGREILNRDANYCDYCGTALGDAVYREVRTEQPVKSTEAPKGEQVSTWLFLGVMCIQFVPVVGILVYLGILLYWAFAASITDSRKSFARASLIYTVVTFAFALLTLGAMVSSIMNLASGLF